MRETTIYTWSDRAFWLTEVRSRMLNEGNSLERAVGLLPLGRVKRWLLEFGVRTARSKELNWRALNQYLKPEYQWHGSSSAHGSALLYQP